MYHKVLLYTEHHSVCLLVGIGLPSRTKGCGGGGAHSLAATWVGVGVPIPTTGEKA